MSSEFRLTLLHSLACANLLPPHRYYAPQEVHAPLEETPSADPSQAVCAGAPKAPSPIGDEVTAFRHSLCTMASDMDASIGAITATLEAKGMWEHTLLWLTGDNGGMTYGAAALGLPPIAVGASSNCISQRPRTLARTPAVEPQLSSLSCRAPAVEPQLLSPSCRTPAVEPQGGLMPFSFGPSALAFPGLRRPPTLPPPMGSTSLITAGVLASLFAFAFASLLGAGPLRGGKATLFEGGVRVASFVSGGMVPQAARGTTMDGLIQHVDIPSTMAKLAGAEWTLGTPDGLNMWPVHLPEASKPEGCPHGCLFSAFSGGAPRRVFASQRASHTCPSPSLLCQALTD